ncbi:MAG: ureidoglycolate lyase, partial [Alphaproteobacteria bacterium]|nr:ureidoglycolate lyase [Alphaproteobacteria bacterium]
MKTLPLRPLTRDAFRPFGELLMADEVQQHYSINNGRCERYHHMATADSGTGQTIVSVFRGKNAPLPFLLEVMERHPLGSQIFMPLTPRPYAIIVAASDGPPTAADLHGFLATAVGGIVQGV